MTAVLRSPADLAGLMGIEFSDQQLAAITAPLEPVLVVAGAGTGKTTVMAARVVWLVGTGQVAAERVLGLTFTTKAASELGRRVSEYLRRAGLVGVPDGSEAAGDDAAAAAEPTVLTYHAYAARLLAEHGLRIGFEPDTQVISDATRFQLAALAVRRFEGPVDHLTTWLPMTVRALLALDAELSEHLVEPRDVLAFQAAEAPLWRAARQTKAVRDLLSALEKRRELVSLVEVYRAIKADRGLMDFSDQMAGAARLAHRRPQVGQCERQRYSLVLLDEYQDTSVAQARLLQSLFSDAVDPAGRGHPVTAVGDPCQAIYGWRGASVGNIGEFPARFPDSVGRPARRFPLTVNRRSRRRILDVANALAGPLHGAFGSGEPLEAAAAAPGRVAMSVVETFSDELDLLAREVPRAHRSRPWSEIAVLARDNKSIAAIHDALVGADIPVEVVGLSGLLQMPEVIHVVSTLQVLSDLTANAALLALLTGPRWAIGARDLALLGRRARNLAGIDAGEPVDTDEPNASVRAALERATAGTDPADLVSLSEALADPGGLPYSPEARIRFRMLHRELEGLRRFVGEPLLDLVRRVVDVTGLEVELASSTSRVATARRSNLATFVDAVSAFAGSGADASLGGLLAYLAAEDEYGQGLPLALPTQADSVKLLTIHRAKGLEWDVVFVPGMAKGVFPIPRSAPRWTTAPEVLPSPLRGDAGDRPVLRERSNAGLTAYATTCSAATETEERRLAYVAVTRARHELIVSCHWWGPEQARPRGPSVFAEDVRKALAEHDIAVEPDVAEPADGATNPSNRKGAPVAWPRDADRHEIARRQQAAALVEWAQRQGWQVAQRAADDLLLLDEQASVREWDLMLETLLEEARSADADEIAVPLPAAMSATTMLRLAADPEGLARDLARPMPRKPSRSARFGTRFHAWVETHVGKPLLLDPDDLPGRADLDIAGDDDLRALTEAFQAGPYGDRPPVQVEAPFALILAGRVVRGRIDAVYETADGFEVVDWKTSRTQSADPLQLAIYRLAWAELRGVDIERVRACFYYVRSGDVVTYDDLPARAALEALLA